MFFSNKDYCDYQYRGELGSNYSYPYHTGPPTQSIGTTIITWGLPYSEVAPKHGIKFVNFTSQRADLSFRSFAQLIIPELNINITVPLSNVWYTSLAEYCEFLTCKHAFDCDNFSLFAKQFNWYVEGVLQFSYDNFFSAGNGGNRVNVVSRHSVECSGGLSLDLGYPGCEDTQYYEQYIYSSYLCGWRHNYPGLWTNEAVVADHLYSPPAVVCTCSKSLATDTATDSWNLTINAEDTIITTDTVLATGYTCYCDVPAHPGVIFSVKNRQYETIRRNSQVFAYPKDTAMPGLSAILDHVKTGNARCYNSLPPPSYTSSSTSSTLGSTELGFYKDVTHILTSQYCYYDIFPGIPCIGGTGNNPEDCYPNVKSLCKYEANILIDHTHTCTTTEESEPTNLETKDGEYHALTTTNYTDSGTPKFRLFYRRSYATVPTHFGVVTAMDTEGTVYDLRAKDDMHQTIHLIWVVEKPANTFKLYYTRSYDKGRTFDSPSVIMNGVRWCAMDINTQGELLIVGLIPDGTHPEKGTLWGIRKDHVSGSFSTAFQLKNELGVAYTVLTTKFDIYGNKYNDFQSYDGVWIKDGETTPRIFRSYDFGHTWYDQNTTNPALPGTVTRTYLRYNYMSAQCACGYVPDVPATIGPGKIYASFKEYGSNTWSAIFIFKDNAGNDIRLAHGGFYFDAARDYPDSWMLICTIMGETEHSHWLSNDNCKTFKRIVPT